MSDRPSGGHQAPPPVVAFAVALGACLLVAAFLVARPYGQYAANAVDDVTEAVGAARCRVACWVTVPTPAGPAAPARGGSSPSAWRPGEPASASPAGTRSCATPTRRSPGWPTSASSPSRRWPSSPSACCPAAARARRWYRGVLDGAILVSALLVITWYTALGQVWGTRSGGALAVADLARLPRHRHRRRRGRVPQHRPGRPGTTGPRYASSPRGMVAMAVADSAFSYLMTLADPGRWQAIDAAWPLAFAAHRVRRPLRAPGQGVAGEGRGRRWPRVAQLPSWTEIVLPYIPLLGAPRPARRRVAGDAGGRPGDRDHRRCGADRSCSPGSCWCSPTTARWSGRSSTRPSTTR